MYWLPKNKKSLDVSRPLCSWQAGTYAIAKVDKIAKAVKKEEAIAMYQQSIRMNPKNEPGKKALARIEGK